MIAFERLVDWVLDALPPEESEQVDAHVLACDACARLATRLWEMGDAVAEVTRRGRLFHVTTAALLERLEAEGLDLQRYEVDPGGSVDCYATATQQYGITRLNADLRGVEILDVELGAEGGPALEVLSDVPFDPQAGAVYVAAPGDVIRAQPTGPLRLVLLARDPDGRRRELGTYGLDHHGLEG